MSGTALPTAGRLRFVASDRTGRPWITLFVLRGVHVTGSGSAKAALTSRFLQRKMEEYALLKAEIEALKQESAGSAMHP